MNFRKLSRYRILFSKVIMIPVALLFLLVQSRWEHRPVFAGMLFAAGCLLVGLAIIGRLWCSLYISGYKTDSLVTCGPYAMCRNPLYLFSLAGVVGLGFATQTFTAPLIFMILFSLIYPGVIKAEELKLMGRHGDAFQEYINSTPCFWPRLNTLTEPDTYTVIPRMFRRALVDAMLLITLLAIIAFSEALRAAGWLPTVWMLY